MLSQRMLRCVAQLCRRLPNRRAVPPAEEDQRFLRVMRSLVQWRRAGDVAAVEQSYRDAFKAVLAENPHLAKPLPSRSLHSCVERWSQ